MAEASRRRSRWAETGNHRLRGADHGVLEGTPPAHRPSHLAHAPHYFAVLDRHEGPGSSVDHCRDRYPVRGQRSSRYGPRGVESDHHWMTSPDTSLLPAARRTYGQWPAPPTRSPVGRHLNARNADRDAVVRETFRAATARVRAPAVGEVPRGQEICSARAGHAESVNPLASNRSAGSGARRRVWSGRCRASAGLIRSRVTGP